MTQTVPSKSTANVTYQGTARSRVPQAVLSRSTDGPYYPRMDNRRPRISSYSPSSRSSNPRTTYRPQRPKKIVKSIWVKKGSTVGSQAVLPQTISVKKSAMITSKQTWRQKGNYLDSVNRDNGSYTLKQFEYGNPEEDLKDYAIIDSGCSGRKGTIKTSCLDFEKVSYVEELKFNLLSFKLVDGSLVFLELLGKNDVYSMDAKVTFIPYWRSILFSLQKATMMTVVLCTEIGAYQLGKFDGKSEEGLFVGIILLAAKVLESTTGKENYANSGDKVSTLDDVEDLDDQQFIVHTAQPMHPEERTAAKEIPLSSEEQTLMMSFEFEHQESLAKLIMIIKGLLFERGKRRISNCKGGKEIIVKLVEAMQEELLQFKLQDVWVLCDLPEGKRVIGTKWVFRNKRDEREEVYVKQPPGFEDPAHPNKVYRVVKALYGLHQAPRACQDKYVKRYFNSLNFRTIKPASTPIEAHKSLGKDEEGEDVDVHTYRSMIGCLMYLTASRPDIMFAVCLCAISVLNGFLTLHDCSQRIFRYLKHQPKLGLWYPKDSPFHLEAFSDSDYAGDNHDRRSTSGGCQYLGRRLVSWQCKKQTIVAISSTEAGICCQ
ncbi:uncharacterized mitochondrial protein-like protein [Tanacetum coccineum]